MPAVCLPNVSNRVFIGFTRLRTSLQVNAEKGQFSVSLKPSVTGNHTASYLASLFQSLELAAKIK